MKMLIISDAWEPQVNGVVRTYQNIIEQLTAMGHDVKVIGPDQFVSMPLPGYSEIALALFPYRRLRSLIKEFDPETIHIAVEGPLGWAARRYCKRNKIPFTTSYHTMFPDYVAKRVRRLLGRRVAWFARKMAIAHVRRFHRPAKATFVATQSLEDQLRLWRFKGRMVRLVRGVDANVFYPGASQALDDYPGPRYLYVGRVAVEKSIEDFLDLPLEGSKIIVGHGPDLDDLQAKYPQAHFLGVRTGADLADIYRAADLFVFPSKTDTFGIVLVEAMACGLAVAGYDVTGPADIVTKDILGAVDSDLGVAVARAMANQGTGQERFEYAQKTYSWRQVATVFLDTASS